MSAKKKVPRFRSENGERSFWAKADSTDFVDWKKAKTPTMPELKPTMKTISLRLPEPLLAELKLLANKRDVPYQSLLKMFLAERIEHELRKAQSKRRKA
ncbi:MAG: BrnA antitoxin family protein [Candidatus Eisenbacteria sp.]|nr:BrnA antitoxin family protein [Candidatus Eisenbacteria bacterium]